MFIGAAFRKIFRKMQNNVDITAIDVYNTNKTA